MRGARLTHQSDVDLTLHELPAGVVGLVKLPIVVELYHVSVALRRELFHHIIHVLVLRRRGRVSGQFAGTVNRVASEPEILQTASHRPVALLMSETTTWYSWKQQNGKSRATTGLHPPPDPTNSTCVHLIPELCQERHPVILAPVLPSISPYVNFPPWWRIGKNFWARVARALVRCCTPSTCSFRAA